MRTAISKGRFSNVVEPHAIKQVCSYGVSALKSPDPECLSKNLSLKAFPASSASKITQGSAYLRIEDVEIKEERTMYSHKSFVPRIKELSEYDYISCSNDKTVKFWKTNSCKEYRSLKVSGYVNSILPLYL